MAVMLRIEGDPEADALYITLSDQPITYSKEFSETIIGDFTEDGVLVGIDIQRVSLMESALAEGVPGADLSWSNFGAQVALVDNRSTV